MNIFVLDTNVGKCAMAHYDRHVVKMCLEYAQILSTAARLMGFEHDGYKSTHEKHPCVQWAAASKANWQWLYRLAIELGREYTARYNKVHKSTDSLQSLPAKLTFNPTDATPEQFVLAMPEEYQNSSAVEAYREYYRKGKAHLKVYKAPAVAPSWL